ncbi:hypothetical protein AYO49_04920 [Verrucomicrobiaceae bacterium SCGC AG-212-N21]|nr:hypothetical protein AYO49_04920 [Verrucomicrobiaceae bacterium SCGC AG-212-N21]
MAAALAVDWDEIRECAVAGVPFIDLARRWGLLKADGSPDTNAIRQRSFREEWPVPRAIRVRARHKLKQALAEQAMARSKMQAGGGSVLGVGGGVTCVTRASEGLKVPSAGSLDAIAETAVTFGRRSQMAILAGLVPQIEAAMHAPEVFRPATVRELVAAGGLIHKLSGLDQDAPEVRLQVAMFTEGAHGATWEAVE